MKTIKSLGLALAAILIGFTSCSEDESFSSSSSASEFCINATIPGYPFTNGTRVNISDDLQTFTWSDGDQLGLYYQGNGSTAHAGFTITAGGGSTGNFENEAFILKSSSTYYAFYPFNENAAIASAPVDFTGQVQNGNGSAAHLGAYNYMYSTVNTDGNGNASIQFKNLGAVMQIRLTVSETASYTSIDITSHGSEFITKGTASMVDGSITATETSASIHLDLENGIALNAGAVLTANTLTAPVDLSGSTLTITLTGIDGKIYEVTAAGKRMLQGKAYLYAETMPYEEIDSIPYVTFTAEAEQTLKMSSTVETLEYSVNGGDWAELNMNQVTFGGVYGDLRLRGKATNGTGYYDDPASTIHFGNATKVACHGDIRTLVDYENYKTADTSRAGFYNLFRGCSQLISAPELPSTILVKYCYFNMFNGCSSLAEAPELPATELSRYCYMGMFEGCTSLTKAPDLPATLVSEGSYSYMFRNCTSLTQVPSILPDTGLPAECYRSMFEGCTSLTSAPELPATSFGNECYRCMFKGCTSLTQAPDLPATTLASWCYCDMFKDCTSLTNVPSILPATTLKSECYYGMFANCSSLTETPKLPAMTLAANCYNYMFANCTSLTEAPNLPAINVTEYYCYYMMFKECSNLKYISMMGANITSYLGDWIYGVSTEGMFVKNKDATWENTYYIPSGWTIIYYDTKAEKYYLDQACTQECDDHGNPL